MPANHLFGCHRPPEDWVVSFAPKMLHQVFGGGQLIRTLASVVWRLIGDPIQAFWALRASRKGPSVVWVCTQSVAATTLMLRRWKILRSPVAVLVHSSGIPAHQARLLRFADSVAVFSAPVAQSVARAGVNEANIRVLPWGPDLAWRPYATPASPESTDVVGFGKTLRDYSPVASAALQNGWRVEIQEGPLRRSIRDGVEIRDEHAGRVSNESMIASIRSARAVVIPIRSDDPSRGMTGLTEVCDAVACSVPIIMTRNEEFPIDLEAAGIGVWVDAAADANEYAYALNRLHSISMENFELVRSCWNEREFTKQLFMLFEEITPQGGDD